MCTCVYRMLQGTHGPVCPSVHVHVHIRIRIRVRVRVRVFDERNGVNQQVSTSLSVAAIERGQDTFDMHTCMYAHTHTHVACVSTTTMSFTF